MRKGGTNERELIQADFSVIYPESLFSSRHFPCNYCRVHSRDRINNILRIFVFQVRFGGYDLKSATRACLENKISKARNKIQAASENELHLNFPRLDRDCKYKVTNIKLTLKIYLY